MTNDAVAEAEAMAILTDAILYGAARPDPARGGYWVAPEIAARIEALCQPKPAAEGCPLLVMLESLVADVRSRLEAGGAWVIVTAPWCDSFNVWRAELAVGDRRRMFHWDPAAYELRSDGTARRCGLWVCDKP